MATWAEMSEESFLAAKRLLDEGYLRSSINRSYYAAYSAVTGELVKRKATFARNWRNPAHEQLPRLILHYLLLPPPQRYRLNQAIRILRMAHEDADYRENAMVNRARVINCLHHASYIIQTMEVQS